MLSDLVIPQYWGAFTSAGNRRLTQLAERLLKEVREGRHDAGFRFLVGWVKMWGKKSYPGVADTAVREIVGDFHDAALDCGYAVWEYNYEAAQRKVFNR